MDKTMCTIKEKTLLVIVEQHFSRLRNGEVWTYDMTTSDFWQRYLNVFDKLVVCGRVEQKQDDDTTGLKKSSRPELEFVDMPNFRGVTGMLKNMTAIHKVLKRALDMADCVLFRAPSPISLAVYPIIKKSGKPFAVEFMLNPLTAYSRNSLKNILQPLIQWYVCRQAREMCLHANGVSYVTQHVLQNSFPCQAMMECDNTKYFTTSYSTITLKKEDYCFEPETKQRHDEFVIINSGKMFDFRKCQDLLIRSTALLIKAGYKVRLVLIGDGIKRDEFQQLTKNLNISEHVIFTGWLTGYKAVQDVLKQSDLFVFPTYGEGLPRSVIEPMANGILTIGSSVDGMLELLPDELLVKEMTAEAYSAKIAHIMDNWNSYLPLRKELYNRSLEYENSILTERRTLFYQRLKDCCNS